VRIATGDGIIFDRPAGASAPRGGIARVTVPLWQLSESTSTRTPSAKRLNSRYTSSSISSPS
jgi:hypothetical protein